MKIVLTMTLKASDAEEARLLAQHVAAFVPDDANRLTEAFSPVLAAPDELLPLTTFEERERNRATTRAEVVAVVPGIRG